MLTLPLTKKRTESRRRCIHESPWQTGRDSPVAQIFGYSSSFPNSLYRIVPASSTGRIRHADERQTRRWNGAGDGAAGRRANNGPCHDEQCRTPNKQAPSKSSSGANLLLAPNSSPPEVLRDPPGSEPPGSCNHGQVLRHGIPAPMVLAPDRLHKPDYASAAAPAPVKAGESAAAGSAILASPVALFHGDRSWRAVSFIAGLPRTPRTPPPPS